MIKYSEFVKKAAEGMDQYGGGVINDAVGGAVTSAIPIVGAPISLGGTVAGLVAGKASDADYEEMMKHPGRSWIPGVGQYRAMRKALRAGGGSRSLLLSEQFGVPASILLLAAAGGLGGAAIGGVAGEPGVGALAGGAVGAGTAAAATVIATLAAALRRQRTGKEEAAYAAKAPVLKNLVIPGYAAYNVLKRGQRANAQEVQFLEDKQREQDQLNG